jgi:pimeloyl-ACP methyl ester carboxylesterase
VDGVLTPPRVLWVNPFGGAPIEAFMRSLGDRAQLELLGLRVWGVDAGHGYAMDLEVRGVLGAAGPEACHLAGFSAGATVVLAAALALGERVRSVTVLEPAFIGDDDWDAGEAAWRSRQLALQTLPPGERMTAFRRLLMRPDVQPPPPNRPPRWDRHDELLFRMLIGSTGFVSDDLAAIRAPVLAIRGGRSHPRWEAVSRRLATVCADAREHVFPELHHFSPPFREQPDALAALLLAHWATA